MLFWYLSQEKSSNIKEGFRLKTSVLFIMEIIGMSKNKEKWDKVYFINLMTVIVVLETL